MLLKSFGKIIFVLLAAMTLSACGGDTLAQNLVTPTSSGSPQSASSSRLDATQTFVNEAQMPSSNARFINQITFTDAKLSGCVEATAKANNWRTINQMTHLSCAEKGIDSIGGIQNLVALESLELQQNKITELAPLANLKSLRILNLGANRLVNIDALRELTGLVELNLGSVGQFDVGGNAIRDISALSHLNALETLNISNNQISDLTPLKNLNRLSYLDLSANQVREIDALFELLPSAQVILTDNNNIPCAELSELTTNLFEGELKRPGDCIFTLDILITDITFSDDNLKSCILDTASSEGWITIGEMTELVCDELQLTNLNGLQHLKALNHLDLTANKLVDIAPLFELTATNSIDLGSNENIACARLDALEAELGSGVVNRPGNCAPVTLIVDLDFIDPQLESCVLYSAQRNGWQSIEQMTSLQCPADLDAKIGDLRGVEQLTALKTIAVEHFQCGDIDVLADTLNIDLQQPKSCL